MRSELHSPEAAFPLASATALSFFLHFYTICDKIKEYALNDLNKEMG